MRPIQPVPYPRTVRERMHLVAPDGGLGSVDGLGIGASAVAILIAVASAVQHRDDLPVAIPLLAIALAPFGLQCSRKLLPMAVFIPLVAGAIAALTLADPVNADVSPFLLVLVSGQAGTLLPVRRSVVLAMLLGAVPLAFETFGGSAYNGTAVWTAAVLFAWAVGVAWHYQLRTLEELRAAQDELASRAATEERQRIARDLHDVIAHTLSITLLHLTGARLALDDDPADAAAALAEAERLGRQSLADIRRTVGLLDPAAELSTAPAQPTAADVATLVAEYRAAGLDADLAVDGDAASVPATVGLAVYRAAQEALANASRHAPGAPVRLRLRVAGGDVELTVDNEAPVGPATTIDGGGLGLVHMRERARSLGGSVDAGPTPAGGWRVRFVAALEPS